MDLASSLGDKSSMRRSFTNMANAYVLLGNHDEAEKCYRNALKIAAETSRKNLESQLFYSLGNVETLRKNYEKGKLYSLLFISVKIGEKEDICFKLYSLSPV